MYICDDTTCLLNKLCYKATADSRAKIRAGEYIIEPMTPSPPLPKHLALAATTVLVKVVILLMLVYCTPTVLCLILGACFILCRYLCILLFYHNLTKVIALL